MCSSIRSTLVLLFTLLGLSCGVLLDCTDVDCPLVPVNQPECKINDTVSPVIGVASFNTSLGSPELAWTVAISLKVDEPGPIPWRKDFYLGTPPELKSDARPLAEGCALFFEGIAPSLRFHPEEISRSKDNGDCEDALTSRCVSDWRDQVNRELGFLLSNSSKIDCSLLATNLQRSPPASCPSMSNTWGQVTSQEIQLPMKASAIDLEDCHPSLSKEYELRRVETFNTTLRLSADEAFYNFTAGITPVLTVLTSPVEIEAGAASKVDSNSDDPLVAPEIHLSCMKAIERNQSSDSVGSTNVGHTLRASGLLGWTFLACFWILITLTWVW